MLSRLIACLILAPFALAPLAPAHAAPQEEPAGDGAAPAEEVIEEEPVDPEVEARKKRKAAQLLKSSGWLEQTKAAILDDLRAREDSGLLPEGTTAKFEKAADWQGLFDSAVASYVKHLDESVMDAAIVFYESPKGKEFASQQPAMAKAGALATRDFVAETTKKALAGSSELAEKAGGMLDALKERKIAANETAIVARLRAIASVQATFGAGAIADLDGDGLGEYGTLGELTGMVGVRAAGDFSSQSEQISPALLSPALASIDQDGILISKGYCIRVLLPARGGGFVHETGPITKKTSLLGKSTFTVVDFGLAGGAIDTEAAESQWCAYAWPEERGETGNRAFFVNQDGDILVCENGDDTAWSGPGAPPPHDAAFTEAGGPGKPVAAGKEARAGSWSYEE